MKKSALLTMVLLILLAGCKDKIEPGNQFSDPARTLALKTAVAEVSGQPVVYDAMGTLTAQDSATLSAKILGMVKAVTVREGDRVMEGDILVVLDERQLEAGLRQSQAGLAEAQKAEAAAASARDSAKAGAALAKSTFDRYQTLLAENSATRQEFDEVEARHRQAQAALAQAEAMAAAARSRVVQAQAALSSAGVSKKDARILAPYDGRVTARLVQEGDLAAPGTPLITLEKSGVFEAEIVLPEQHLSAVTLGQPLAVAIPALGSGPLITGTVRTIVPAADRRSRSFTIKVGLPQDERLRSGMFVRVNITVGETSQILIPQTAMVITGQLTGIFAVDEEGRARFRLIRPGRRTGGQVEVISGLAPGTRYVLVPPPDLADGTGIKEGA